jgi:hypothetical protein
MSGIKYEKLTGKDLIAALRGGACGDLLEDAAHAAADEIERLREFIEGLPDGDEIVRLRGLLTRIHGIAAEPRPVNMAVRLENIACIASGERDATYAQLAEAPRFLHGAETESISRAVCREDLPFLSATAQPEAQSSVCDEIERLRGLLREVLAADRYDWNMGLEDRIKEALSRRSKNK